MTAFHADMAFALELIALGLGVLLLQKTTADVCCRRFSKLAAYIIIIGSFLTMACTLANTYKEYKNPDHQMMHQMMMGPRVRREGPMKMGARANREMPSQEQSEDQTPDTPGNEN